VHRVILLNRFFDPDESATSQLATNLALEICSRSCEFAVVTSRLSYDGGVGEPPLPSSGSIRGVRIHRVWTTRFGRGNLIGRSFDYLSFYKMAAWRLLFLTRRGTVIIAMTDPPLISIPAAFVAKLRGARLVNWLQDVFPEVAEQLNALPRRGLMAGILRRLRNASLRGAAANVVIGERMRAIVAAECPKGPAPIVIPNWALEDASSAEPAPGAVQALRAQWGLAETDLVVGYSGNLGRAHRLAEVIEAAALLRDVPGLRFLFIGDGAQRASLEARVRELGLRNVAFQPSQPRERLGVSLRVPDMHVVSLAPELEGLIVPSKFVGVLAVGRPVLWLGDPEGEVGTLVRESECGLVVAPGNVEALAAALRELAGDRTGNGGVRMTSMGAAALALWAARFQRARAMEAWAALIDRLTGPQEP
jgi:glycosyltransferase involved in cell wall biosynthesis